MRDGQVRDLAKWDQWWQCFRGFLLHYAEIAEDEDVEMLCLGCEMNSTEEFDDRWRALIAEIRAIYDGAITYDVNHGRETRGRLVGRRRRDQRERLLPGPAARGDDRSRRPSATTPKAEILAQLAKNKQELADLSAKFDKPILFIETGVTNVRGCARYPWSHPDAKLGDPARRAGAGELLRGDVRSLLGRTVVHGLRLVGLAGAALRPRSRGRAPRLLHLRQTGRRGGAAVVRARTTGDRALKRLSSPATAAKGASTLDQRVPPRSGAASGSAARSSS